MTWATDTQISMPEPNDFVLISFGGFGFTSKGLAHDLSLPDWEAFAMPTYSPEGLTTENM